MIDLMQARVLELSSKARYCTMVHDGELSIGRESARERESERASRVRESERASERDTHTCLLI